MNHYRTHKCNELKISDVDKSVNLSGWVNRKRDHGGLLFIDLRDHYGLTQLDFDPDSNAFDLAEKITAETVIKISGKVVKRDDDTINSNLSTGEIEVYVDTLEVLSEAEELPLPVFGEPDYPEDIRLKYRFLDLRRETLHGNIVLRSKIIQSIRNRMIKNDFLEFQTPIMTASSPEGARDFLIPSRIHQGSFYALPQAPQQFKQILMASGFDKYFQIAPCFRDEDARADRSPGEFYQLDIEMSFVEQKDVFQVVQQLIVDVFKEFSTKKILQENFPQITYEDALLKYGSDKPDLRKPLIIFDTTKLFLEDDVKFEIFKKLVKSGSVVRALKTPKTFDKPRSFFDGIDKWAKEQGASGLAYLTIEKENNALSAKGPVGKLFSENAIKNLMK